MIVCRIPKQYNAVTFPTPHVSLPRHVQRVAVSVCIKFACGEILGTNPLCFAIKYHVEMCYFVTRTTGEANSITLVYIILVFEEDADKTVT